MLGTRGCCGTPLDSVHDESCPRRYGQAPDPRTGALKADGDKPRLDLVPVHPVMELARVLTYGAEKYAERNWEKGFDWGRVYAALQRHLLAWWDGEDADPESGLSHLAHALACLSFLSEFERTRAGRDDRPGRPG